MTNLSLTQLAAAVSPEPRASSGQEPPPPPRLARLFSSELVGEAQVLFARRMEREVSESEARVLLANLTGYFRVLTASS